MSTGREARSLRFFIGAMEGCWLAAGFGLVERRFAAGSLPAAWLLAGAALAFALARWARRFPMKPRVGLTLAACLAWTLAAVKTAFFPGTDPWDLGWLAGLARAGGGQTQAQIAAAAAAAAWAWGSRLALMRPGVDRLLAEFQFGVVLLMVLFFCADQWKVAFAGMGPAATLFFLLFLLGAALAQSGRAGQRVRPRPPGSWIALAAVHAAAVTAAGMLLAAALTPEIVAAVLSVLAALWHAAEALFARLMAFLAGLLPQPNLAAYTPGPGGGPTPEPARLPDLLSIPDYIRTGAQCLVVAFWLAVSVLALWRMAAQVAEWLGRRLNDGADAEVQALPGAFRSDLLRLARWLRDRWRRIWRGVRWKSPAADGDNDPVRAVYRAFLLWSADNGCARARHETPREFLERMATRLPGARQEMADITGEYERVRFGESRPGDGVVPRLSAGLQRLRATRRHPLKGATDAIADLPGA